MGCRVIGFIGFIGFGVPYWAPDDEGILFWGSIPGGPGRIFVKTFEAIAMQGPVVVSVDATSWDTYGSGIFDGCSKDARVNHAVPLS